MIFFSTAGTVFFRDLLSSSACFSTSAFRLATSCLSVSISSPRPSMESMACCSSSCLSRSSARVVTPCFFCREYIRSRRSLMKARRCGSKEILSSSFSSSLAISLISMYDDSSLSERLLSCEESLDADSTFCEARRRRSLTPLSSAEKIELASYRRNFISSA